MKADLANGRQALRERLVLIATFLVLSRAAVAQDALSIAIDEAKVELAARQSWAGNIPPVSQVARRGNTLRISIGTPVPPGSTQWQQWWRRALCAAPELKKIMLLNGGVQVYAGAEPVKEQEVFFAKSDCYAEDPDWNTRPPQVLGPEPGYNVAPAPSAASVPAHRVARSTAATFKTKKIASRLPLSLTMPDDFADVTERIYGAIAASGTIPASDAATYCDPADAEFTRDQLYGKRAGELPNKGCFIVMRNRSYGYDANERRFSVEKDIEAMNRWAPSRSPRFEVKNHSLVRREVSGVPILSFIQDSLTDAGTARLYFLYVADGADTWAVLFTSGKHDDVSAAIWDALLSGLQ